MSSNFSIFIDILSFRTFKVGFIVSSIILQKVYIEKYMLMAFLKMKPNTDNSLGPF